jgi:hypothetical protein
VRVKGIPSVLGSGEVEVRSGSGSEKWKLEVIEVVYQTINQISDSQEINRGALNTDRWERD